MGSLNLGNIPQQAVAYRNNPMMGAAPYPEYESGYLNMDPVIAERFKNLLLDKSALNKFQEEAMRTGPSQYAKLAGKQNKYMTMAARDQAAQDVASGGAEARAALASKRGLTSGAAERIATGGRNKFLDMSQGISAQGAQNANQIAMNDEQNRISQLSQVPGMQVQSLQPEFQKEQLIAGENARKNAFNLGRYNAQMGAWGANKQAEATANAGKK